MSFCLGSSHLRAAIGTLLLTALTTPASAQTSGAAVGFDQAIDLAIAASTKRAESEQDLAGQTARRKGALAELGPKVSVQGLDARFDKRVVLPFGPETFLIRDNEARTGTLLVSQSVTGLYGAWEKSRVERAQEDLTKLAVEQTKIDAAFAAAEAYRQAQAANEVVVIARSSIAATEGQVRDARSLVASGKLIRSDLLKIEMARQEAQAALARAQAAAKKAGERLAIVAGLPQGTVLTLDQLPGIAAVQKIQVGDPKTMTEAAQATRIEPKQAALGIAKADYVKKETAARFLPDVGVFAQWDRQYGEPPFGTPPFTRTYGLNATWLLWDNGARIFADQEAAAMAQKSEVAVREVSDKLRYEVFALNADLEAAKQALETATGSVTQAEEAYRLDKARFAGGLVTATDLVISESAQTRAEGAVVAAVSDVDILGLMIQKAVGEVRPKAGL